MAAYDDLQELTRFVMQLGQRRFFGTLEVKFESGRITTLKKTETLKPGHLAWDNHRENRGKQDDRDQ